MDNNNRLTKTIVIRITDRQYRRLIDSVKLSSNLTDSDLNNKSKIIRDMIDKYLMQKIS